MNLPDAREPLVPVTFKLPEVWQKLMEVICFERGHKRVSETYREAVKAYIDDYHRSKAA